jgi:FAD/FMN-containing dehydrogenase
MVCSSTQDAGLFDAALGGLGQCAVIVRATLPLEPWRSAARIYTLVYEHLSDLVDAHRRLAREGRFDRLVGTVHTRADEGWTYLLCATTFFEHSSAPQDDPLLDGIAERAVNVVSQDKDFKGWLSASFAGANHLTNVGLSDVPHPDLDVVLPDETVQTFMIGLLSALNPDELAGLPVTLVAIPREKTRSSVRMPDADLSFAVSVPRSIGEGADVTAFETMLATNRHLFERARELGGTRQATGAIPFTQDDWAAHFGAGYESFSRNKDAFDPKGLLAPGARMWSPRRAAPAPAHVLR